MRFLFPWIIKRVLKKQFSNYSGQGPSSSTQNDTSQQSNSKKEKKDKLGEYVEYEEIKENDK